MSSFGKFISTYPKIKILNLLLYPLLIYFLLLFLNLISIVSLFSFIYWAVSITFVVIFITYEYNRLCIFLDTKRKQEVYFNETDVPPIEENSFTSSYKDWLFENADILYKYFYNPLDFNSISECCVCCTFLTILFFAVSPFVLLFVQGENALITTIAVSISLLSMYTYLKVRFDRKMYKQYDSEIKRILYEEVTGYSPIMDGKLTNKYRRWLIIQAKIESASETYRSDSH